MKRLPQTGKGVVVAGFSLVELLVVISIIGLLAGLSSVVIPKAMESGRKAKAKGDLTAIVAAVKAYKAEYGRFPTSAGPGDDEHLYASYATAQTSFSTQPYGKSADLIAILCGENRNGLNPKGVKFLEPGKLTQSGAEKYIWYDPWDKSEYCVMFDSNEDGGVEYYGDGNWEHPNIRLSVIAVSAGPNKKVDNLNTEKKPDDILSWK